MRGNDKGAVELLQRSNTNLPAADDSGTLPNRSSRQHRYKNSGMSGSNH